MKGWFIVRHDGWVQLFAWPSGRGTSVPCPFCFDEIDA